MKLFTCITTCALVALVVGGCQHQDQQLQGRTPSYQYHKGQSAVLKNGKAIAPAAAPQRVKRAIAAANKIAGKPYRRGGGHGRHVDRAYDCSGTTAFVLREAGMLGPNSYPTSGQVLNWGRPGHGTWTPVHTKPG